MKSISVIGFGTECPERNLYLAKQAGKAIAQASCITICGGTGWTFNAAFNGAKQLNGVTKIILENSKTPENPAIIDDVIYVADQTEKHELIATESTAAIVIGGGPGSAKLITKLFNKNKPVFMVKNTGGITESPEFKSITHIDENEIDLVINQICS